MDNSNSNSNNSNSNNPNSYEQRRQLYWKTINSLNGETRSKSISENPNYFKYSKKPVEHNNLNRYYHRYGGSSINNSMVILPKEIQTPQQSNIFNENKSLLRNRSDFSLNVNNINDSMQKHSQRNENQFLGPSSQTNFNSYMAGASKTANNFFSKHNPKKFPSIVKSESLESVINPNSSSLINFSHLYNKKGNDMKKMAINNSLFRSSSYSNIGKSTDNSSMNEKTKVILHNRYMNFENDSLFSELTSKIESQNIDQKNLVRKYMVNEHKLTDGRQLKLPNNLPPITQLPIPDSKNNYVSYLDDIEIYLSNLKYMKFNLSKSANLIYDSLKNGETQDDFYKKHKKVYKELSVNNNFDDILNHLYRKVVYCTKGYSNLNLDKVVILVNKEFNTLAQIYEKELIDSLIKKDTIYREDENIGRDNATTTSTTGPSLRNKNILTKNRQKKLKFGRRNNIQEEEGEGDDEGEVEEDTEGLDQVKTNLIFNSTSKSLSDLRSIFPKTDNENLGFSYHNKKKNEEGLTFDNNNESDSDEIQNQILNKNKGNKFFNSQKNFRKVLSPIGENDQDEMETQILKNNLSNKSSQFKKIQNMKENNIVGGESNNNTSNDFFKSKLSRLNY